MFRTRSTRSRDAAAMSRDSGGSPPTSPPGRSFTSTSHDTSPGGGTRTRTNTTGPVRLERNSDARPPQPAARKSFGFLNFSPISSRRLSKNVPSPVTPTPPPPATINLVPLSPPVPPLSLGGDENASIASRPTADSTASDTGIIRDGSKESLTSPRRIIRLRTPRRAGSLLMFLSDEGSRTSALRRVLDDQEWRTMFREHLQKSYASESVQFFDAVYELYACPVLEKKQGMSKAIVETFVLDNAPHQVYLKTSKEGVLAAYASGDLTQMLHAFKACLDDLFDDLKHAHQFQTFLRDSVDSGFMSIENDLLEEELADNVDFKVI